MLNILHDLFHFFALVGVLWCVVNFAKLVLWVWPQIEWAEFFFRICVPIILALLLALGFWKLYDIVRWFI